MPFLKIYLVNPLLSFLGWGGPWIGIKASIYILLAGWLYFWEKGFLLNIVASFLWWGVLSMHDGFLFVRRDSFLALWLYAWEKEFLVNMMASFLWWGGSFLAFGFLPGMRVSFVLWWSLEPVGFASAMRISLQVWWPYSCDIGVPCNHNNFLLVMMSLCWLMASFCYIVVVPSMFPSCGDGLLPSMVIFFLGCSFLPPLKTLLLCKGFFLIKGFLSVLRGSFTTCGNPTNHQPSHDEFLHFMKVSIPLVLLPLV